MKKLRAFDVDKTLTVGKDFLSTYYGVTIDTVNRWDITPEEKTDGRAVLYNFKDVVEWHKLNINTTQSNNAKNKHYDPLGADADLEMIDISEADRRKKINEVRLGDIKIKKELGELIDASDVDKTQAELAVSLKSHLITSEKILTILLENKKSDEIGDILHDHNNEILSSLTEMHSKEFEADDTLIDIIYAITKTKKTPNDIIEFLSDE